MASAQKKVIVRQFEGGLAWGYLPRTGFLDASEVRLMEVAGRIKLIPFSSIKIISYVLDFNLDDSKSPERLGRKTFANRPRGDGLWIRLVFLDGDVVEGLSSFDTSLLDSLVEDRGLFLRPPDARSNTQGLFVPRPAIASVEVLGLIRAPARPRAAKARKLALTHSVEQPSLFDE